MWTCFKTIKAQHTIVCYTQLSWFNLLCCTWKLLLEGNLNTLNRVVRSNQQKSFHARRLTLLNSYETLTVRHARWYRKPRQNCCHRMIQPQSKFESLKLSYYSPTQEEFSHLKIWGPSLMTYKQMGIPLRTAAPTLSIAR